MVNPIKGPTPNVSHRPQAKKKSIKEIDSRIKKAVKKSNSPSTAKKQSRSLKASQKIGVKQAYLAAEKAAYAARLRAFEIKKAAVKAQKSAFLAQRGHMAQQAAAARRALAAEKAKKAAERAARKASTLRRMAKIKAYVARPEEKRTKWIKKYIPSSKKKKNS